MERHYQFTHNTYRNQTRMPTITISLHRTYDMPFNDIHKNDKLKFKEHRVTGMDTDQILYADDTICISEDEDAKQTLTRNRNRLFKMRLKAKYNKMRIH